MNRAEFSFVEFAEEGVSVFYDQCNEKIGAIVCRVASAILLSPAGALDLVYHGSMFLFTTLYQITDVKNADFSISKQHLLQVRDAVAPLLFGSVLGVIYPAAAAGLSNPYEVPFLLTVPFQVFYRALVRKPLPLPNLELNVPEEVLKKLKNVAHTFQCLPRDTDIVVISSGNNFVFKLKGFPSLIFKYAVGIGSLEHRNKRYENMLKGLRICSNYGLSTPITPRFNKLYHFQKINSLFK